MDEVNAEITKKKKVQKTPVPLQQRKFNLIKKLSAAGVINDKQLCSMTPAEIIELFHDITQEEMQLIFSLQFAVGSSALYAFLCSE